MERLFIAAPLTDAARSELRVALAAAFPHGLPGRVVPPESWHLTLRFLGDTAPDRADRVSAELERGLATPPFRLVFGRCGAFPRAARASVLWVGVREGAVPLSDLAATVERAASAAGFPAEERPFSPHLTLTRLRPARDARALLDAAPELEVGMPVREVVLFRSRLGGGPARYEPVCRFPLR